MKPLHASVTRLTRCRCCQSKYSKHNSGHKKAGKTAARQKAKAEIRREISQ